MHTREYYALKGTGEFVKLARAMVVPNEHEIDLFVHRSLPGTGYKWTVTEGETGTAFGAGPTRKDAIRDALANVDIHGIEQVLKIMAAKLMQYGHSPRYPKAA